MSDQSPQKRTSFEGPVLAVGAAVAVFALLCVLVVCVIAVLTLLGPAIGNVFSSTLAVQECSVNTDVFVFEDTDGDGAPDVDETGIENVKVSVAVDEQPDMAVERTGADGHAFISWVDSTCENNRQFEILVDVPNGYEATGPTAFGPYPVAFMDSPGPLSVGLK